MIDTHCHLADRKFAQDLPAVLRRAREAGVERIGCIADSVEESRSCIRIAEEYPDIFCTVGVHPHMAKDWKEGDRETLAALAKEHACVRAIGEIGLDYHYDFSPRDRQREVFKAQLDLAGELNLPAVVHCREAIADVRSILREKGLRTIVLHCCSEKWEDVEELVAGGIFLSFTGIATYPDAEEIRRVIRLCPLEQMMVETDAPYLSPVPHRGKRNEPAFVMEIAKLISQIKNVSFTEVATITTYTAMQFFRLSS